MLTARIKQLLDDPCTPFWAREVIALAIKRDPIKAANVLAVIAEAFDERADAVLGIARDIRVHNCNGVDSSSAN
jgi:hypothetical protein